jgi:hypothetical protein
MIEDYVFLSESDGTPAEILKNLVVKINKYLNLGFEPCGPPFEYSQALYQAMIKRKKDSVDDN